MNWLLSAFTDEAGVSVAEQIAACKRASLKHLDLRGIEGHSIIDLPEDTARDIKAKLDAADISVHMFGSPIGKLDISDDFDIDAKRLDHLAVMRDVFGCNLVRIFSYYNKQEKPSDVWQTESLNRLKRLRDQAGKLGLVLFHENERHIFGDRCSEVEVIASELRDATVFKLIFDFDNYNQSGDDVWENWLRLKDKTDAFHLKDSDGDNQHVPVGKGQGKVREILADAVAGGWDGPLSLEPHLQHSKAVMATGVSGSGNSSYADMTPADAFHSAADSAIQLMDELNVRLI